MLFAKRSACSDRFSKNKALVTVPKHPNSCWGLVLLVCFWGPSTFSGGVWMSRVYNYKLHWFFLKQRLKDLKASPRYWREPLGDDFFWVVGARRCSRFGLNFSLNFQKHCQWVYRRKLISWWQPHCKVTMHYIWCFWFSIGDPNCFAQYWLWQCCILWKPT